MYSSVTLCTFILLCNHHHHPSPEVFSFCKTETLYSSNKSSSISLRGDILKWCKLCVSSNFHTLILSSLDDALLQLLLLWYFIVILYFSFSFYIYYFKFYHRKSWPISPIYLIDYSYQYGLMDIYYIYTL